MNDIIKPLPIESISAFDEANELIDFFLRV